MPLKSPLAPGQPVIPNGGADNFNADSSNMMQKRPMASMETGSGASGTGETTGHRVSVNAERRAFCCCFWQLYLRTRHRCATAHSRERQPISGPRPKVATLPVIATQNLSRVPRRYPRSDRAGQVRAILAFRRQACWRWTVSATRRELLAISAHLSEATHS